ncbi:MAG: hypothetical protein AAF125_20765 [Chloroflexota bacterium]
MFMNESPSNFHAQYPDVHRHWSPRSEGFAGADCLVTALRRGWDIDDQVMKQTHDLGGARGVNVYLFHLRKGEREIFMPILENPYVTRLLFTSPFDVLESEDRAEVSVS